MEGKIGSEWKLGDFFQMRGFAMSEETPRVKTLKHIQTVRDILNLFIKELLDRQSEHDQTKIEPPEAELFEKLTPKLAETTYGSDEYEKLLDELAPALEHHYEHNDHHPEHFENGIKDMNLIQLLEMFADWRAATERHDDGDIRDSIEKNQNRFGYSDKLKKLFHNTADMIESKMS